MTRMTQPIDGTEHIAPSFEADGAESWQSIDPAIATPAVAMAAITAPATTLSRVTGTDDDDELGGTAGDDVIHGLAGNDSIIGQAGNDTLFGDEGNDTLYGWTGNDVLFGGDGDDVLEGGSGKDNLNGGAGNDFLSGGTQDDLLSGGAGADTLDGGQGYDTVTYSDSSGGVFIDLNMASTSWSGDAQGDSFTSVEAFVLSSFGDAFFGAGGADTVDGGAGADVLLGRGGNDFLSGGNGNDVLGGGAGADTLSGGDGYDTVFYGDATAAVSIDLKQASSSWTGDAQGDVLTSIEEIDLTNFADIFRGDANANVVFGLGGDDILYGDGGGDILNGGGGNDALYGGVGNDLLTGSAGTGDRAVYADATAGITVDMAAGIVTGDASVGTDTLREIEQVVGSNFADRYVATGYGASSPNASSAGNAVNTFEGMAGNDVIIGNGDTQVSYRSATSGVTVDLAAGTATGDASVGTDSFTGVNRVRGSEFDDTLLGSNNAGGAENFTGGGGNDFIDGRGGNDRVIYSSFVDDTVTAGVTINLAAGTVTGDASVGTDTLRSIEFVRGSNFADIFDATGFTATSTNAGSGNVNTSGAAFNEIEGMGGNDTIIGNGNTRVAFYNATAGVTVDIQAGTATGDASVGSDTFTNVSSVVGSQFADAFYGSNNPSQTTEQFEGRGGNDFFDGRGGFDQAVYNNDTAVTAGISVNMAAHTVTGDAAVGTDTLVSIESVRGTNFADTYVATGFSGASTDTGLAATFNEFEGLGGNDTITGNGNTRISFVNASAGVTVDIAAGTATGNASVGSDTFTGVSRVRGSNFDDTISGGAGNNVLEGRGGNDTLTGGAGNDTFVYADGGGADIITDFVAGASSPDRIDLTGVSGVHSLADILALTTQNGPNTVISFGGGNTITLQNVTLSNLSDDDFIFATNQASTNIPLSGDTVPESSSAVTVNGTVHADADAEMHIYMSHYQLTANDFLF